MFRKLNKRGEKMKILKWLLILLAYVLLVLVIKNIQIILPILFEYKEIVVVVISYLFAIVAIILNCIFKSQSDANEVDNERKNKI